MNDLSNQEYKGIIFKLKLLAQSNAKITFDTKMITCSLGMCNLDLYSREISYRKEGQICPLDMRKEKQLTGCYWHCAKMEHNLPDNEIKQIVLNFNIGD